MVRLTPATSASTQPGTSLFIPAHAGKHADQRDDIVHDGLIPAHTGKTSGLIVGRLPSWAHPRAYGENGD